MRAWVGLGAVAAVACGGVDAAKPPEAPCEEPAPAEWQVLLDAEAWGPRFHDGKMYFSRGKRAVDAKLSVWSFWELDLATGKVSHFKTMDTGDRLASLHAVDDAYVWIRLGPSEPGDEPQGLLRLTRDDPRDAPLPFCRDAWRTTIGDGRVFCADEVTDHVDAVPANVGDAYRIATFPSPARIVSLEVVGDALLIERDDGLWGVPVRGGVPRRARRPAADGLELPAGARAATTHGGHAYAWGDGAIYRAALATRGASAACTSYAATTGR